MSEKKNLLVVDDEEDITLSIVNYFKKHLSDVNVYSAFDGTEALQVIKSHRIDILITDIRMPGINGIDLILELKKVNPEAKAIVITAFGSELIRRKSESAGALHYIEKPFKLSHLCILVKKVIEEEEEGFKGNVSQLQLIDVLQMLCINKRTMVVDVKNRDKSGRIYILNGEVIHCECETKKGKEACFEILSWKNGEFNLFPLNQPSEVKRTINENWMNLFMEGMKKIDELNASGNGEIEEKKRKIREIITSIFQKIEGVETNIIIHTEKKKLLFDGEFEEDNTFEEKVRGFSKVINNLDDFLISSEGERLKELVLILENSFLILMKISSNIVWLVKINDIEKLGMAKIVLEKAKNMLIKEI